MGRVSQKILDMVMECIDALPDKAKEKCALCNKTLTHIVKQIEAKTGAGTTTITNQIAGMHNKTAAPQDRVTGEALRGRIRWHEGSRENLSGHNDQIKNHIETINRLLPEATHDDGHFVKGERLIDWVLDNGVSVLANCNTCTGEQDGPLRFGLKHLSKELKNKPCGKWDLGYKSCFNCESLSAGGCPNGFWEAHDALRKAEVHKETIAGRAYICREWQPKGKLFPADQEAEMVAVN